MLTLWFVKYLGRKFSVYGGERDLGVFIAAIQQAPPIGTDVYAALRCSYAASTPASSSHDLPHLSPYSQYADF